MLKLQGALFFPSLSKCWCSIQLHSEAIGLDRAALSAEHTALAQSVLFQHFVFTLPALEKGAAF